MTNVTPDQKKQDMKLFWACFVGLSTTSFGVKPQTLTLSQRGSIRYQYCSVLSRDR